MLKFLLFVEEEKVLVSVVCMHVLQRPDLHGRKPLVVGEELTLA